MLTALGAAAQPAASRLHKVAVETVPACGTTMSSSVTIGLIPLACQSGCCRSFAAGKAREGLRMPR
jgi:hypothetical protein